MATRFGADALGIAAIAGFRQTSEAIDAKMMGALDIAGLQGFDVGRLRIAFRVHNDQHPTILAKIPKRELNI